MESYYKVTQSIIVKAHNNRQAAHIAKALQAKMEHFTVERLYISSETATVDLSKEKGQRGYETVSK